MSALSAFTREVYASASNDFTDNYDALRFGKEAAQDAGLTGAKKMVKRWTKTPGVGKVLSFSLGARKAIALVRPHVFELEKLYASLADEESRAWLIKLLAFRALGYRRVKLPLSTPKYWQGLKEFEALSTNGDLLESGFQNWKLQRLDLRARGIPVALYSMPVGVYTMFELEQYRCACQPLSIGAEPGDVVVDGGGCWGDTALYFANRVGQTGRVFTFEFLPTNLKILRQNLRLNPELESRIEIMEHPLWEKTGVTVSYREAGPATTVSVGTGKAGDPSVLTLSIDDLVAKQGLSKLDLIKMDIEGAELSALKGSEQVLRRFKPKLAITVYHRLGDFFEIPAYLESLGLGYRFYLRHFTIHAEETVLFATAR